MNFLMGRTLISALHSSKFYFIYLISLIHSVNGAVSEI